MAHESHDFASPSTPADMPAGDAAAPLPPTGVYQPAAAATFSAQPTLPETSIGSPQLRAVRGTFGIYELVGELGFGGMGVVYLARHSKLGRLVALKTLRADLAIESEQRQRFDREMQAAARLNHPHIVPIYEVNEHEGRPYYTMPYLSGGNLAERRQALVKNQRAALELIQKVANAVHFAHEQGVIHRDLKPANLLLDDHDEPHVADFGLARLRDSNVELTQSGAVLGTPAYMAPEQAAGHGERIGPPTDVWALGVILYELLTGRRPFLGESGEEIKRKILEEDAPAPRSLRSELPLDLEQILLTCLHRDPAERYATAAELARDLERFLSGEFLPHLSDRRPVRAWRSFGRHPYRSTIGLLLLAALFLLTTAFLSTRDTPGEAPSLDPPRLLLGRSEASAPLNWLSEQPDARSSSRATEDPFILSADQVSLVQLQPHPPWEHFRMDAEVQHEASPASGEMGFFCGYSRYSSMQSPYHTFLKAGFADRGGMAGEAMLAVWRYKSAPPYDVQARGLSGPDWRFKADPGKWRHLVLLVTAEGVSASLDEQRFGIGSNQELEKDRLSLFQDLPGVVGASAQRGPLGIYVQEGKGLFRNVTIRPLP